MRPPKRFDIGDSKPTDDAHISYFIKAFQLLERRHDCEGFTVCFAWGAQTKLPQIDLNVIVVIYGDEQCRIPAYVNEVAVVFKTYGSFPHVVPRTRPLRLAQIELAEFVRNLSVWLPHGWRWLASEGTRKSCHTLPLGYQFVPHCPVKRFSERPYLLSFRGSLSSPEASSRGRAIVGTPKKFARASLANALARARECYGDAAVRYSVTSSYYESTADAGRSYFDDLASTKICVAPRGTSRETFRVYEGLMLGCIVVSDRLPKHDFYRDSPIIQIDDWGGLDRLLEELLGDAHRMEDLHRASLRHWEEVMSERALADRLSGGLAPVFRQAAQCLVPAFGEAS